MYAYCTCYITCIYHNIIQLYITYYTTYYIVYIIYYIFLFANFADDGEHSLVETNVYYTRLAEPIGKLWATNPRSPQGHTQCYQQRHY